MTEWESVLLGVFLLSWGVVAYTYLVFPLLLARRARQQPPAARPDGQAELPSVAMVVAAYNEAAVLPEKLANTWAIDYPPDRFSLWIGSDGSDDGSTELLTRAAHPRLHAFPFPVRRGKISVLNDLVARVDADILLMSDANTMYEPDSVRLLAAHFADQRVGCVSGELCLEQEGGVSGEGLYWKYENWIKANESRLGLLIGCNGGIFALRRELYRPLPESTIVEDFVLSVNVLTQGYRVLLEPAARAHEPACASARAEMIRKIRIGAGGFQALGLTRELLSPARGAAAFAYWGHKVLRWLVPVFWLTAFVANCSLAVSPGGWWRVLMALQLAGVPVALWAYLFHQGPPKLLRPISYFYLMNYALFCGLLRFVLKRQRVTWERERGKPIARASG